MTPERYLWQRVLEQAFVDATYDGDGVESRRARDTAHSWITNNGKDFKQVCLMAGMDPDFLSDRYKAGQVNRELLKAGKEKESA